MYGAPCAACKEESDAGSIRRRGACYPAGMRTNRLTLGLIGCLACFACQPLQPPEPQPPATGGAPGTGGTGATPEDAACDNMLRLDCPEGRAVDCAGKLRLRCSNPSVDCDVPCLANAATKTDLQNVCGLGCGRL